MDRKSTYTIVLLLVVGSVFFVTVLFFRNGIDTSPRTTDTASTTAWQNTPAVPKEVQVSVKTIITAKHAYRNGEHIIAGEIPLPTPCHILESSGIASADKKTLFLSFLSSIKTGEVCAEVITPARFKITVRADKNAKIVATLNGQEVTPNLIEAGPDENLDNFDLYIKG